MAHPSSGFEADFFFMFWGARAVLHLGSSVSHLFYRVCIGVCRFGSFIGSELVVESTLFSCFVYCMGGHRLYTILHVAGAVAGTSWEPDGRI